MIYKFEAVNINTGLLEIGHIDMYYDENPAEKLPRHLTLLNIRPDIPAYISSLFKKRMSSIDLSRFFDYLSNYQAIGTNILKSLNIFKQAFPKHTAFLDSLISKISMGDKFSAALSTSGYVPHLAVTMVKVGEDTGSQEVIFRRLHAFYKKNAEAKDNLKKEIIYPAIVFTIMIAVFYFIAVFLIPKIRDLVNMLSKGNVPLPTKIIFFVFEFLRVNWWVIPPVLLGIVLAAIIFKQMRPLEFYTLFLKIPVAGDLFRYTYLVHIFICLELFQSNGVDILTALDQIRPSIKNRYIIKQLESSIGKINVGGTLSSTLSNFFPTYVKQAIMIGEEQGSLEDSFRTISEFYQERLDGQLKYFSMTVGVVLTIIMGILLLAVGLAVFMPIYNAISALRFS